MSVEKYLFAVLLLATFLMLTISYLSYRIRTIPVARFSALMMLAASFYSLGSALEVINSKNIDLSQFWLRIEYIGIPFISTFWIIIVIHFTGYQRYLKRGVMLFLFLIPILTLLLHFTNDFHHLYYRDTYTDYSSILPIVYAIKGPWYWVHIAYNHIQALVGVSLFVVMYMKAIPIVRKQIMAMILGAAAPWLFNIIYLLGTFGTHVDLTPLGFALTGVFYIWGIYRFKLLRLTPIAMQEVFETMQDGVIVLDYDNMIVNVNNAAKDIFHELSHLKDNANSAELVFANEPELLSKIKVMVNSETQATIVRSNETRYYHVKVSILYDKSHIAMGKILLFHNITPIIDYQESLQSNVNQLAELNVFKDKLFTLVTHDIRDPLAVLINLTELLGDELEEAGSDNVEIFQEVSGQVKDTFTLVENLLDWFRSQRGSITFRPLSWELAPIVEHGVQSARSRSELKKIQISTQIPEGIHVFSDKEILQSVLRNLLSNAIKFTDSGGNIHIAAAVAAGAGGDKVVVSVNDTGRGLHKSVVSTLFRETQVDPSSGTEGEKGTGLGLYLSKEFVHLNGGEIWFESEQGQGTTFYFSIPRKEVKRLEYEWNGGVSGHEGHNHR